MGKHMSTKEIMQLIASELQDEFMDQDGVILGEAVLRRQVFDEIMFLNVTSSTRRMNEFWRMMHLIPGFRAPNQYAFVISTAPFLSWLGVDGSKPIAGQVVE